MNPSGFPADQLIDDFSNPEGHSRFGTRWRLVTDAVMGGVSRATMTINSQGGRRALCIEGGIRLEQNGGFVQANLDLTRAGAPFDATHFAGVRLIVRGNGERYNLHLKTRDCAFPWQAYRTTFVAAPQWREVRAAFQDFSPYQLATSLAADQLTQLGLVAIGRAFQAQLCVAELSWYRDSEDEPTPSR